MTDRLRTAADSAVGAASRGSGDNNNGLLALQRAGGDPACPGAVRLEYFGHMAFRLTTPMGLSLLLDPWANETAPGRAPWFLADFPALRVDVALSTHDHYDHNALRRVRSHMVMDRLAGQWRFADVRVTGLADKHQYRAPGPCRWTDRLIGLGFDPVPPNNPAFLDNTVYLLETGGLRLVHWGDNRPDAPESLFAALRRPDVLILPVDDSWHLLDPAQIGEILDRLEPACVIPAHYHIAGLTSPASTLRTADGWVGQCPIVEQPTGGAITLRAQPLRAGRRLVLYFGGQTALSGAA